MSSPTALDPYLALGVSKDADLATIRTAHRKLVLKHHPDRIRDEAQRELGKIEFQKVQQAYELLSDSTRRARYDDKIKFAEYQREKMMARDQARRDSRDDRREPTRTTSYSASYFARSANGPDTSTSRRSATTDGPVYEDRAPPGDFFDSESYFDVHPSKPAARKSDSYEKKASTPRSTEKKDKTYSKWHGPMEGMSFKMATNLKTKASEAKERSHKKTQEARDREKRRDRSDKSSRHAAYVSDYSDSDSDTEIPSRHSSRTTRPPPRSRAEPEPETETGRSRTTSRRINPSDDDSYDEKWEQHHRNSTEYINQARKIRPGLEQRAESDAFHYWNRRSGSDSERRHSPPKSRRSAPDEARARPTMPVQSSAPSNLRPHIIERQPPSAPPRSKTNAHPSDRERESRREPPSLGRSQTMPVRPKKDQTQPVRGSNLKHGETQDSGYSSMSPEMRGDDGPRESSRRQPTTKKYPIIVDRAAESDTDSVGPRVYRRGFLDSDDEKRGIYRSPERGGRERERERDRERDRAADRERERERERDRDRDRLRERPRLDTRSRSARGTGSIPRADHSARYESSSPRDAPPVSRNKLFGEVDAREPPSSFSHRPDSSHTRSSSYRGGSSSYRGREPETDFGPDSRFRDQVKYPTGRRTSTAAY